MGEDGGGEFLGEDLIEAEQKCAFIWLNCHQWPLTKMFGGERQNKLNERKK